MSNDKQYEFLQEFTRKLPTEKAHFTNGDVIVDIDSEDDVIFVVERGNIKVTNIDPEGNQSTLLLLKRGEAFPIVWAFDHPPATAYRYESFGSTEVLRSKRSTFKDVAQDDAGFTKVALEMFVLVTWDLLERLKGQQMAFTFEKLVRLLPYIAAKAGDKIAEKKFAIPREMTRSEMAQLLGTARESISVQIKKIKEKGYLKEEMGREIIDLSDVPDNYVFDKWFED